jgi:DNA-binding response OmpR family regulator
MVDDKHVVLVVDDDSDVRSVIVLVLQNNGFDVVEATGAEEGLRKYKAVGPDLVIVDLMMEEVDSGTGLVKELQLLGNTAPVFMLSSVGDALHDQLDYAELGLSGVFQKPLDTATLLAAVRARLSES